MPFEHAPGDPTVDAAVGAQVIEDDAPAIPALPHGPGGGDPAAAVAAFAHLADPPSPLAQARAHGADADAALARFRGVDGTAPGAGLDRFRAIGHTVLHRNRELASLTEHAATADVATERDRGVLWSGDHYEGGKATASAMLTAQAFAGATGRKTVEMTDGGRAMDSYIDPQGDSFGALQDRFRYLRNPGDHAGAPSQAPVMAEIMQRVVDAKGGADLAGHAVSAEHSAAGGIWDVLSQRFATGLSGDVVGVHAYPEAQHDALTRGPLAHNTFNTVEKPAVAAAGRAEVVDVFGDDALLAPHLRPPRR